mgnify:FL=1
MKALELPLLKSYDQDNFFILAGPCVVESKDICRQIASTVAEIADKYAIPYVFKASYRKANRSRVDSFTGIGDQAGLEILQGIKEEFHLPIITDIHNPEEAALAASYCVDILQIPAFLCRQTELLEAAAKTGRYVNIKKGQFLAPDSMKFAAQKVEHFGNSNIILTDRGTQFGYSDLIIDFRGVPTMKSFGYPVVVDITHSLQEPNQSSGVTGGRPDMISTIAKASIAVGADGLFLETHPDPSQAKSDGANMLRLDLLENLIKTLLPIRQAIL